MSEIFIYWGKDDEPTFEWRQRGEQAKEGVIPSLESPALLKADLDALVATTEGKKVTLILPAEEIFSGTLEMPQKARRHMRKAAPFMLEEQLAEPVSNLFFAYQPIDNDKVAVRAVNLSYLQTLLDEFKSRGIMPQVVLNELDLLPQPETGIDAVCIGDKILVCDDQGQRWSCDKQDFNWLIQRFVAQQMNDEELPVAIPLRVYTAGDQVEWIHQLPVGQFAIDEQVVENTLDWLITQGDTRFNLLQAELAPKKEKSELSIWLSRVAVLGAVLLAAHLLFQGSLWFKLNQQKKQLEAEKIAIYKQAFRGKTPNRDAYVLMRSYIKRLGQSSGDSQFLQLLDSASAQLPSGDVIYPTNISFDGRKGELRLDLFAQSLELLNSYRDALAASGHQVDASSATQNGEGYTSRLTIRRS